MVLASPQEGLETLGRRGNASYCRANSDSPSWEKPAQLQGRLEALLHMWQQDAPFPQQGAAPAFSRHGSALGSGVMPGQQSCSGDQW